MPAPRQLICLLICFLARTLLAGQESSASSCVGHKLTTEQVKERLLVRSLTATKTWGLDTLELSSCLGEDGVAAQIVLSLPKGWSSFNVPYRMRFSWWLDPESGIPTRSKKNIILQSVEAKIKKLLLVIEREETLRSFVERYQPLVVWIDLDNGTDKLLFDFQSKSANDDHNPHLLLQANVPGFVVGYRVSRLDGLPVRRELLRFAELVSMQLPGCIISDIKAQRQESAISEKAKKILWTIDAKLYGKGCQSAITLTIDENGNNASDTEN